MNLNLFFPLLYLNIVILFLSIILILVLGQIFSIQTLQKQLGILKIQINLNQASLDTYLDLGQIFLKKQMYSNAIEIYRKCLVKWDRNDKIGLAHLYIVISSIYSRLALFDIAQTYLEKAIFNIPTCITTLKNLTYIYRKRNLFKKYIEINTHIELLMSKSKSK